MSRDESKCHSRPSFPLRLLFCSIKVVKNFNLVKVLGNVPESLLSRPLRKN